MIIYLNDYIGSILVHTYSMCINVYMKVLKLNKSKKMVNFVYLLRHLLLVGFNRLWFKEKVIKRVLIIGLKSPPF